MAQAGLKALAQKKRLKVGHFIVEFATPGVGHIMKNAGCDFVLFDMEHSGFGFETVKSALRYMQAADLPAIVRVPSKAYHRHRARLRHGCGGRDVADGGLGRRSKEDPGEHEILSRRRSRRRPAGGA